jgi:hypothetical protein
MNKTPQETLDEIFKEFIQPENLITLFENDQEFIDWLRIGTVEEMGWALKVFEKSELYRHCDLIKKEMENGKA